MSDTSFDVVKAANPILTVATDLGLKMKSSGVELYGACPICAPDDPRSLMINPQRSAFFCFKSQTGGDATALTEHVMKCTTGEAVQLMGDG